MIYGDDTNIAQRDQNAVPTMIAVSATDGKTPVVLYADPITHRLYVDVPGGAGTGIDLTDLSALVPLTYDNVTGVFGIDKANATQDGYLDKTDWATFNGKLDNVTGLLSDGTNVTITGTGTVSDPYVINASGGISNVNWGDVTGTLADQTDLQTVLDDKLEDITGLVTAGANVIVSGSGTTSDPYEITASGSGGSSDGTWGFITGDIRDQMDLSNVLGLKLEDIGGLISAGTNVTLSGTGTTSDPYVINASGGGSGIALTDLSATAPISYDNTTGVFSMAEADTSTDGYLSSTDWNTFNNKQNAIGFTPEDVANKATDLTSPDNTKYPTTQAVATGLSAKQDSLGFTAENTANKKTTLSDNSDTYYPTQKAVKTAVDAKQDSLGFTPEDVANKVVAFQAVPDDTHYASEKLVKDSLDNKQDSLGFTPENSTNKENATINTSTTKYPTVNLLKTGLDAKIDKSIVNAKGDILTATADDTPARLAVGTDGQVLTVDSNEATGLKYTTPLSASSTNTLTNKRINPRLVTAASYTTDTGTSLDVSTCDQFEITAQAGALKFNNPGGTPVGGQKLIIRITDNGTARALTYDTQFRAMGNALPSTTVAGKTLYMGFIWNATDSKFDLVAVAQES